MIVAIDLDGTTVPASGQVSPGMVAAVHACQRAGHTVVIATGRTYLNAVPFAREFGVAGPLVCAHGADVRGSTEGERLWTAALAPSIAQGVVEQCAAFSLPVLLHAEDGRTVSVVPAHGEGVRPYAALNPSATVVPVTLPEALDVIASVPVLKVVCVGADSAIARRAYAWQLRYGEDASVVRSMACFVEVTSPLATKGHALARLASGWGVTAADVIAFGDSENDVSMLRWAGRSYAPRTAMDAARRAAKSTMPSVDDDGVAVILGQLGLLG